MRLFKDSWLSITMRRFLSSCQEIRITHPRHADSILLMITATIGLVDSGQNKKQREHVCPLQKQLTIETKNSVSLPGAKTCFKSKQRNVTNPQTSHSSKQIHIPSTIKDMSSAKKFQSRNSRIGKSEDIHSGTTQSLKFWLAQCQIPMWIEIIVRGMAPTIYSLVYKCDIAILGALSMLIYISDIFMNKGLKCRKLSLAFSFSSH